ncbi:MAG TPA: hypothetical protein DHW71_05020 [Gammaproteobacteria bacterium]|nr:hypothetical protein [Gammaproteobacteria bacterium]
MTKLFFGLKIKKRFLFLSLFVILPAAAANSYLLFCKGCDKEGITISTHPNWNNCFEASKRHNRDKHGGEYRSSCIAK